VTTVNSLYQLSAIIYLTVITDCTKLKRVAVKYERQLFEYLTQIHKVTLQV